MSDTRQRDPEAMMQTTTAARARVPELTGVTFGRGNVPLPRRWARAKAWSVRSRVGLVDVDDIKRMLSMERANRG